MKRFLFFSCILMFSGCWNVLCATSDYQEDMDSLLHKIPGHRQGILVQDEQGIKLELYMSLYCTAPNGILYYRWWDITESQWLDYGIPNGVYDPVVFDTKSVPLSLAYRFDDTKMYVYNFDTQEEYVAYDFSLQPGERFTTPDGICWKIVSREGKVFETTWDGMTDYKKEHIVLAVQSEDGKIVDEWVEYIGSLNYPIQNWGRTDIKRSRTAFFNYDHDAFKLLAFPFFEDPIYGQYVEVERPLDVQFDGGDYFKDCTISMGDKTLNLTLNCFYTTMRYFCYTYRNGNELDIHTFEVGPYRDGDNAPASSCLTFPGIPSNDPYAIVLNEERLSTSINVPQKSNVTGQSFDLQGRQLKSAPQKGIYIQDGKKVLVK